MYVPSNHVPQFYAALYLHILFINGYSAQKIAILSSEQRTNTWNYSCQLTLPCQKIFSNLNICLDNTNLMSNRHHHKNQFQTLSTSNLGSVPNSYSNLPKALEKPTGRRQVKCFNKLTMCTPSKSNIIKPIAYSDNNRIQRGGNIESTVGRHKRKSST